MPRSTFVMLLPKSPFPWPDLSSLCSNLPSSSLDMSSSSSNLSSSWLDLPSPCVAPPTSTQFSARIYHFDFNWNSIRCTRQPTRSDSTSIDGGCRFLPPCRLSPNPHRLDPWAPLVGFVSIFIFLFLHLFMLFDLVMFMFFFPYRFDVHILLFWVCSLILGLMSLLCLFFDLRRTLKNKFLCS